MDTRGRQIVYKLRAWPVVTGMLVVFSSYSFGIWLIANLVLNFFGITLLFEQAMLLYLIYLLVRVLQDKRTQQERLEYGHQRGWLDREEI